MKTLLKKKPVVKEKPRVETQTPPVLGTKPEEQRPVATAESPRQRPNDYLAFTIQRYHDGVQWLYEMVQIRVVDGKVAEVQKDPGTTREIVESRIFRDLSAIVF